MTIPLDTSNGIAAALSRAIDAYAMHGAPSGPKDPKQQRPSITGITIRSEAYVALLDELHVQGKTPESVRVREVEITPHDFAACIRGDAPWCPHCRHEAHAKRVSCGAPKPGGQCDCTCRITADRHGYLEKSADGHCITFGGSDNRLTDAKPARPWQPIDGGKPVLKLNDGPMAGPLPAPAPR
jgi:hypothetical protein